MTEYEKARGQFVHELFEAIRQAAISPSCANAAAMSLLKWGNVEPTDLAGYLQSPDAQKLVDRYRPAWNDFTWKRVTDELKSTDISRNFLVAVAVAL
ncbi:hypothetical protein [Pseudomonas nitroreducens]|uniref:hypothetical protein n=1 Tax=Pseudomonas nitroreducens TaxID=46680 RepID=UPI002D7E6C27|nr:hypothetical protein [Pseudomonas nitroreducens]